MSEPLRSETLRRRLARSAIRVLTPPALLALVLGGALQTDVGRRFLILMLAPSNVAVAAELGVLSPKFDGADKARPHNPVRLEPVIRGVPQPTNLAFVPGHPDRVVVLGKQGSAWLVQLGTQAPPSPQPVAPQPVAPGKDPWFQVEVATASELGLLGIAFHPDFIHNGLLFVNTTPSLGGALERYATRILRLHTDPATLSPPTVDRVILEVEQPYQNHNAGQLVFGPDGMLYIGLGDGGFRADPHGNGQNTGVLLGKMLRVDVDRGDPYAIPDDNPLRNRPGARPEIWAFGLRNPWRFTFDPAGRMVVADVGQDRFEEIDLVAAGDNLGWNLREADTCFEAETCSTQGLVDPIWKYGRDEGISVTGGVVWTAQGPLQGRYLFGDFGTGKLWALELPETRRPVTATVTALGKFNLAPTAFVRTPTGEVWVADYAKGGIFRIVNQSSAEPR